MKGITVILLCLSLATMSAQPIAEMTGAYQQSLGGVSSTMTGVHAVFANPAGIAEQDSLGIEIAVANPFSLKGYQRAVAGIVIPVAEMGVFGVSVRQEQVASLRNTVATLSYARPLTDRLRVGIQADWLQIAIDGFGSTSAVVPEIGLQYDAIRSVVLSAHIVAPGEIEVADGQVVPAQLELGMRYAPSEHVACHLAMRKVVDRPVEVIGALEYDLHDKLQLRLGANTGTGSFSAGATVHIFNGIAVHFALAYHERLGATPSVGGQWLP